MKKKKIITFALIFTVMFGLGTFGVNKAYSYFTDTHSKTNKITVGYNESVIEEVFPEDQELEPGSSITKKVSVKNTGPVECFVRVFVGLSDENIETDKEISIDYNTKDWTLGTDGYWYYNNTVEPGDSTSNLFTTVMASSSYENEDFDIIVYEETAQSKNASTNKNYSNASEAFAAVN